MNSIGVDFKIKNVEVDGKIIKLQIVKLLIKFSGTQQVRSDLEQLLRVIIEVHMQLLLYMI